jgi:hypothetical protein
MQPHIKLVYRVLQQNWDAPQLFDSFCLLPYKTDVPNHPVKFSCCIGEGLATSFT